MQYNYQIGDKVLVRPDFTKEDCSPGGYVREFENFRGKTMTIKHIKCENGYALAEDRMCWTFSGNMFMPPYQSEEEAFEALINEQITSREYTNILETLSK
jgi:hypothetical protein